MAPLGDVSAGQQDTHMSLAEVPNYDDRRSATPEFDRTPPQDLVAEQSVLGGMLLSKDAIGEVVEVIRHRDFYRPAHELIFDVIVDLYGRGEPADAVTVAAELTKRPVSCGPFLFCPEPLMQNLKL